MLITYPLLIVVDDLGAIVADATVSIAGVTDRDGVAISSPGATVHAAGGNVSVEYDAEAKGEAWITLAISKTGSTITGLNAAPAFFLSRDPSRINRMSLDSAIGWGGSALPTPASKPQVSLAAADVTGAIDANVIEVNGSPVSTSNTAIDANVIEVNGSPVSTSNTAIDANVVQIDGSASLGTAFGTSVGTIVTGAVSTASFTATATAFETTVAFTRPDELKGRVIVFAAGSSMGREAASISSSAVGSNGNTRFTVPSMTKAPANTDAFVIV